MKIKSSFVTNSSSTSFVITSKTSGWFSGHQENLKKLTEEWIPDAEPTSILSIDSRSIGLDFPISSCDECDGEEGIGYISLRNIYKYDGDDMIENNEMYPNEITMIEIDVDGPRQHTSESVVLDKILHLVERLANAMCKEGDHVKLAHFQYPNDLMGDGWNGGDPAGQYAYTNECYIGEVKLGYIHAEKKYGEVRVWTEFKSFHGF